MEELEPASDDCSQLVERIRAGTKGADDEFVERFERGVIRIVRRSVFNAADAQDIAQSVLIVSLRRIKRGGVREPEKLRKFVHGVAYKLVRVHFRKLRGAKVVELDQAPESVDPNQSPLAQLEAREEAELAFRTLAELKAPRDQEVIKRYFFLHESKEKILADLGLSSLHFNRVLFRALDRFRELLKEKGISRKRKKKRN